jgi:hypothetical protein
MKARKYYCGKDGAVFPTYFSRNYYHSYYVFEEGGSLYSKRVHTGVEALLAGDVILDQVREFVEEGVWEEISDPFSALKVGDLVQGSDGWVYKITKVGAELIQASVKDGPNRVFLKATMQEVLFGELKLGK